MNEPVAWMSSVNGETVYVGYEPADGWLAIPLYTHPAKTLTDEEIEKVFYDTHFGFKGRDNSDFMDFARAILRKAQTK